MNHGSLSLREKYIADRIMRIYPGPKSLLDIGCGDGNILKFLKEKAQMNVFGVDTHEESINNLIAEGLAAVSNATRLTFEDGQFDWSLLSGVLHHIPDAKKAMGEAFRVSKSGVIVTEPWHDMSIQSHRFGAELDDWAKQLHQALGFYHVKGLNAGEILNLLPKQYPIKNISIGYETLLIPENIDAWFKMQEKYSSQLPDHHVITWKGENLRKKLENQAVCDCGWVIVVIEKVAS